MNRELKKIIALLLAVITVLSIGNLTAFADSNYNYEKKELSEKNYEYLIDNIVSDNDEPKENGIWINNISRKYFISIINTLSDQTYTITSSGYLNQMVTNIDTFNTYDEKLYELINGNKIIMISIDDCYTAYNNVLEETYSIFLEDDEFTVLFNIDNNRCAAILNYYHYAEHRDKLICKDNDEYDETYFYSDSELMNKFLEPFYQDTDFVNAAYGEQTQKEIENLLIDDNEIHYKAPKNEVLSKVRYYSHISEFDAAMYGMENTYLMSHSDTDDIEDFENRIIIDPDSQDVMLNYLNTHGVYTYSIYNDCLVCDNIEKDNKNLDCGGETEVDKEIAFAIESGLNFIIKVSDSYYTNTNGMLEKVYFSSNEYTKSIFSDDKNSNILYLNSAYFNLDMGYNPATSDRFVKSLLPEEFITQTYSTNELLNVTGKIKEARTVYFGPSSSDYASIGSVDKNENIIILGKSVGWYFISYRVGSTSTYKSGYVPVSVVSNVSATIEETNYNGGYNYSETELTVKSHSVFNQAVNVGTIFAGEGFTELQRYTVDGKNVSLVEFSTTSGTKRGFVYSSNMSISNISKSSVAYVIADSSAVYSGPDSSYVKLGGVSKNEFISILTKNNGYVYAEYNTTSGRKRGYIQDSNVKNYVVRDYPKDNSHISIKKANKNLDVYSGPNSNYAKIGTVFNQEIVSYLGTEKNYSYIEYTTSTGAKRGYVVTSNLENASAPAISNIQTYTNFTSGTYGKSGLGKELKWYKIGTGKNIAFAVFEQHGWEDAWAFDGVELLKIADTFMSKLSSTNQNIFKQWTVYVIPSANPDGLSDGYTNNGPGRCTISTKTDMNRCWPSNFVPNYTSRNYTGDKSLGAIEASSLKNFIESKFGNNTNVVLDIHGWLNKTYGDTNVGSYFCEQFGFSHSSSYGSGYLETWAYNKGAKACLVEFPMPTSSSSIITNNYSGKFTTAFLNMIKGLSNENSNEGGTEVNDICQVKTNTSVNVRSGPGTSYNVVTSLTNGTQVTRIRKAIATANGYTWDKIKLENGTVGYMATNYLVKIS